MKISHCSECGVPYADAEAWPRVCDCGAVRWLNPVPVVAVMQPVSNEAGTACGILIAKRAIEPCKGQWALVGGFMEVNESVQEAGAREFREETGIEVAGTPRIIFTEAVGGRVRQQLMLMTYVDKHLNYEVFKQAKPCSENEELGLLFSDSDIELAFPTHRRAVEAYFSGELFSCHRPRHSVL